MRSEAIASGTTFRNPFDKGWRKNVKRVFGDVPWYTILLPSDRLPLDPEYPFDFEATSYSNANHTSLV